MKTDTRGALWLLAVALASAGCLACASSQAGQQAGQQPEDQQAGQQAVQLPELAKIDDGPPNAYCPQPRDVSECSPAGSVPIGGCRFYEQNSDWLPPAYVFNATCICTHLSRKGLLTEEWRVGDDPTAQCARAKAVAQIATAPEQLREQGRLCNSKEGPERDACFAQYVAPALYQMHLKAYTECCCPCGPSAEVSWMAMTTERTSCPSVGELFDIFGSCNGTPGKW